MKVDESRVAVLAGRALNLDDLRLTRLGVSCACPVFRAESASGGRFFLKIASPEGVRRNLDILQHAAGTVDCLPRIAFSGVEYGEGRELLGLEWKDGEHIEPEDMTAAQCRGLVNAYLDFSRMLATCVGDSRPDPGDDPETEFGVIADYAAGHPLVSRLIRPLLAVPAAERGYSGRALTPIHGDFQSLNYAFRGDAVSAIYDFDGVSAGVACEDLAYAFGERVARCRGRKAGRLRENFAEVVKSAPWSGDDWRFAVNRCRLRKAFRRIAKHRSSPLVALDVMRRDSFYAILLEVLDEGV